MAQLRHRALGAGALILLPLLLILASALPALAQQEEDLKRRGFSGTVTRYEPGESLTVKTAAGEELTVALTQDTRVRLPSKVVQGVLEAELKEGARVAVLAQVGEDGSLTALWVLVKPQRPLVQHLMGTVVSIEGNRVTLVDAQGKEHTVELPMPARWGLEVGQIATLVIKDLPPQAQGRGLGLARPLEASAAVSARKIQERLAAHAQTLQEQAQAGEVSVAEVEERIRALMGLMDTIRQHLTGVLNEVMAKAPEPAQEALQRALVRTEEGFRQAKEALTRAEKALPQAPGGPPEEKGPPSAPGRPGPPGSREVGPGGRGQGRQAAGP